MKIFVDTNVFLRFLLADHPKQSPASRRLFEEAKENKIKLTTHSIVIVEIIWTLQSFFGFSKQEILDKLNVILHFNQLEIIDCDILVMAVEIFGDKNVDFIDAYVASYLVQKKIYQIYSFDKDFDKIGKIKRIEP